MVSRNTLRSRLLALATGAGLAVGLLGVTGAQAAQYQIGELDIFLDTTVSVGASVRTASRIDAFLPSGNGGPQDTRPIVNGGLCDTAAFTSSGGTVCDPLGLSFIYVGAYNQFVLGQSAGASVRNTDFADNFDGSINTDDGRLNYDRGDFIGGAAKVTHDLLISWRNFRFFTRAYYFYDAVLNDASSAKRYALGDDVRDDVGHGFRVLDAVVSADFEIPLVNVPATFRQGYQVINWGEATFFLNGISSINPIDVTAFRRPGSEIKEAFIPVHASFIQMALPYEISVEAFYQWDWRPYRLDAAGTPFSGSDALRPFGGVPALGGSMIGGAQSSGTYRRNCDASALYADPMVYGAAALPGGPLYGTPLGVLNQIGLATGGLSSPSAALSPGNCNGSEIDMRYLTPIGQNEEVRIRNGDMNWIPRAADVDPKDSGQWGVAVRYYADWLNTTEFGFYFTNTHSRLPYAQLVPGTPQVSIDVIQEGDSALTRQVAPAGCLTNFATGSAAGMDGFFAAYAAEGLDGPGFLGSGAGLDAYAITAANDPNGYLAAAAPIADTILAGAGITGFTGTELQTDVAAGASLLTLMQINCAFVLAQSGVVDFSFNPSAYGGIGQFVPLMATGAELINWQTQHTIRLQYPEDIRMFGFSFNTTLGTWGVQGELAYRDNMPLQIDTDSLTIASALQQCAFPGAVGDVGPTFEMMATNLGATGRCDPTNSSPAPIDGFRREKVLTGDIGTTATYTASNPLVGLTGADLFIFLTEAGFVYVPDAPKEGDFSQAQLANTGCQGSDLPLGGLLSLDFRTGCRPDAFSYGYLLLGRLDYNNVMGAFTVSPTVVFSHDVEGTSPAPISNYVEDSMALSLSVGVSYQNTWRGSIGYNSFFGGGIENKSRDRDFASMSISYSF